MHVQFSVSPIWIEVIVCHIKLPDAADSSDSDDDNFTNKDTITGDDFKPTSFGLVTEANFVMDMDSVVQYFEDNNYPLEKMFGEHGSESGAGTDRDEADYDCEVNFGSTEADVDLNAGELQEILADSPWVSKGKAKVVKMAVDIEGGSEGEDTEFDWT
jgi:hypothetical protein